jgi:hypothetical protein
MHVPLGACLGLDHERDELVFDHLNLFGRNPKSDRCGQIGMGVHECGAHGFGRNGIADGPADSLYEPRGNPGLEACACGLALAKREPGADQTNLTIDQQSHASAVSQQNDLNAMAVFVIAADGDSTASNLRDDGATTQRGQVAGIPRACGLRGIAYRFLNKPEVGGAKRDRTADLLHAMQALSQLSYGPISKPPQRLVDGFLRPVSDEIKMTSSNFLNIP